MEHQQERSDSQVNNSALKYFDDINAHRYIYLGFIGEPKDNSLRLVIEEAISEPSPASTSVEGLEFGSSGISVSGKSCVYEVIFDTCIGYSVLDESFALPNDDDIFKGRIFCVYEKSVYLDYLKRASFACDDLPGPFKHYGFSCLNHIVDVASTDEPRITLINKN